MIDSIWMCKAMSKVESGIDGRKSSEAAFSKSVKQGSGKRLDIYSGF